MPEDEELSQKDLEAMGVKPEEMGLKPDAIGVEKDLSRADYESRFQDLQQEKQNLLNRLSRVNEEFRNKQETNRAYLATLPEAERQDALRRQHDSNPANIAQNEQTNQIMGEMRIVEEKIANLEDRRRKSNLASA